MRLIVYAREKKSQTPYLHVIAKLGSEIERGSATNEARVDLIASLGELLNPYLDKGSLGIPSGQGGFKA
jgi:hypothetical protein